MPYEQLIDRVARTNAYPKEHGLPTGWLGDLEPDEEGTDIVATIQELRPTEQPPPPTNWARIAAIVAVVVAIAVAALVLRNEPDVIEDVTTTTARSSTLEQQRIDVAREITNLLYEDDAVAMADALADADSPGEFLTLHRDSMAINAELVEIQECLTLIGSQARCVVTETDDTQRAFDSQATAHVTVRFHPETALVVEASWTPVTVNPNIDRYFDWVNETYPDPEACAGLAETGIPDDPGACRAEIMSHVDEFKATDLYEPQG